MRRAAGIAIEPSRTVLVEGDPRRPRSFQAVGDGYRQWVPNAVTDGRWGTPAVGGRSHVTRTTARRTELFGWRTSPWSPEFFTGVRHRFEDYLGRISPVPEHGYQVAVVAASAGVASEEVSALARSAGLAEPQLVGPTEALIASWLADQRDRALDPLRFGIPAGDPPAQVVVVACGETSTVARSFRVRPATDLEANIGGRFFDVEAGDVAAADGGLHPVVMAVAAEVLDRRRDQERPVDALALLDAVDGYAELMGAAQPTERITWDGVLAEDLRTPYRLSPSELRQLPECVKLTQAVAQLVAARGGKRSQTEIVLGGPGAAWPIFEHALSDLGRVSVGPAPALALAVGACHQHLLPDDLRGGWAHDAAGGAVRGERSRVGAPSEPIAPWLRGGAS